MENLSSVLARRRKELGLTLAQIADAMNVSEATVQRWESGKIKTLRHGKISKLATFLRVSPAELMGWSGNEALNIPGIIRPDFQKKPLVGDIACGTPITAEENIEAYLDVRTDVKCDFLLRCKGDSMAPRLLDGDIVFIRQQPDVEDGQIAAVLIDTEATLKHVYHLPNHNGIQLVADNPEYAPMVFMGDTAANVLILGKAVAYERGL